MNNISIALGKRQLVDSIWKSAGIEGLGTTFPNTEKILANVSVETKRDEVLFIMNMKRAWYFLFDNIDCPTNLSFLQEVNKICMDGLRFQCDELRRVPVTIGGTSWVPDIPNEQDIIDHLHEINEMPNKIEAALEAFCYIARTQMFLDGNEHVAQLVCNKIMMENDAGIFSIPYDEIDAFKELLVEFYATNDVSGLKDFFRDKCLLLNPDHCMFENGVNMDCVFPDYNHIKDYNNVKGIKSFSAH